MIAIGVIIGAGFVAAPILKAQQAHPAKPQIASIADCNHYADTYTNHLRVQAQVEYGGNLGFPQALKNAEVEGQELHQFCDAGGDANTIIWKMLKS
jgi:hypothetical protein